MTILKITQDTISDLLRLYELDLHINSITVDNDTKELIIDIVKNNFDYLEPFRLEYSNKYVRIYDPMEIYEYGISDESHSYIKVQNPVKLTFI